MTKMKLNLPSLFVLLLVASLTACGSSSGSSSGVTPEPTPNGNGNGPNGNGDDPETGIFIDGPVGNIGYRTETREGVTSPSGQYEYEPGETVVFFIGDLEFPPVLASGVVTPLDIVGTTDTEDPRVINIIRLLQTLDADGDPSNGITITEEAKANATQVDFNLPVDEFANSPAVQNLIANGGQDTVPEQLVSVEDAVDHFEDSLLAEGVHYSNATSLAGSWILQGVEHFHVMTFDTVNGVYLSYDESMSGGNHFEYGTYVQDPETGLMSAMDRIYPVGATGDDDEVGFVVEGHVVTAQIFKDGVLEDTATAHRVVANGIVGTWVYQIPPDDTESRVHIFVFTEDGDIIEKKVLMDLTSSQNNGERGSYTYDASAGILTIVGDEAGTIDISISGNTMIADLIDDGVPVTMVFRRL